MQGVEVLSGKPLPPDFTVGVQSLRILDALLRYQGDDGVVLWFDHRYIPLQKGIEAMVLLHGLSTRPEKFARLDITHHSLTSARAVNIEWEDWGGPCFLNFKGPYSVKWVGHEEGNEYLTYEVERRYGSESNEAGKLTSKNARAEVVMFFSLLEKNPDLFWEINAPVWRPLAVVTDRGGEYEIRRDAREEVAEITYYKTVKLLRRLPFTAKRLDEYVYFQRPDLEGVENLRRLWGFEENRQVYLRGVARLGKAQDYFINAHVLHDQLFTIVSTDGLYGDSMDVAWMNYNNMAIDGSVGDLEVSRVEDDMTSHGQEIFGSVLMYLSFVQRISPELLSSDTFIGEFFDLWRKGIGSTHYRMIGQVPQLFEDVIHALDTALRFYQSALDTTPHNTSWNGGNFLAHHKKDLWVPNMKTVVNRVKQLRGAVGF